MTCGGSKATRTWTTSNGRAVAARRKSQQQCRHLIITFSNPHSLHTNPAMSVCKRTHLPAGSVPLPFNFLLRL